MIGPFYQSILAFADGGVPFGSPKGIQTADIIFDWIIALMDAYEAAGDEDN